MRKNLSVSTRFHELSEASPTMEMSDIMTRVGQGFGMGHFTYFYTPPKLPDSETLILTDYPSSWQDRYQSENYHLIDPVISRGFGGILPLDWATLPCGSAQLKTFFGEANEHGVLPLGISVPIRDHQGGRALLSVNIDVNEADWEGYKTEYVADMTYLAFLFHDRIMRQSGNGERAETSKLMPQEVEVLRWAAFGKTVWETSSIMSLSERTINFYLANAYAKLKVVNKPQAVAKCVSEGIFDLTGDC